MELLGPPPPPLRHPAQPLPRQLAGTLHFLIYIVVITVNNIHA
jgi:hypothetical protein